MTDPTFTHIAVLLDRSGSMASIRSDVEGGFDAFMTDQRNAAGRCTVSLAQFDDRYDDVYTDAPITDVPPLALQPRGRTAMLDAIGRLVTETGERLSARPDGDRPGTVIIAIITDGLENASREWTYDAVKALLTTQEETYDWTFLYLGANQDAVAEGAKLGVSQDRSLTYAAGKVSDAYAATSASIHALRTAAPMGRAAKKKAGAFTDAQRRDAN
jgi:hypothetical protein